MSATVERASWLDLVGADDIVFLGSACGEPQTLVESLVEHHERWRGLRLLTGIQGSTAPYAQPEYERNFRLTALMASRHTVEAFAEARADYIPTSVYQTGRLLDAGRIPIDVALIQVAPPDADGYCSLGVSVAYNRAAVSAARTVIAEVNQRMPRTIGEGRVHLSEIDTVVESDRPVLSVSGPRTNDELVRIAQVVAEYVPDGATLQIGVGGVSDAIWRALSDRNDLGVHAGAAGDAVMDLLEAGVITGVRKPDPPRPVVAGQLIGSERLYDFASENPAFWLGESSYTHNASVMAGLGDFVSVVSALQVDLDGQVNCELIGGRRIAGIGGSLDFAMGARLASGGCSIVALPSTAGAHRTSRIVPRFADGVVTLPAALVDVVVTEYGAADLRGLSLGARRRALISIAAPEARDWLEQEDHRDLDS